MEAGQLFLTEEFQIINVEGVKEIENQHLNTRVMLQARSTDKY